MSHCNHLILSLLFLLLHLSASGAERRYASSSVLSEGRFVKISVGSSGVYAISRSQLAQMGFSRPECVRLYGYGGELMSEEFSLQPADDLPEVATWLTADALLFYARGTVGWSLNNGTFCRTRNSYSDTACYFLTERDDSPTGMACTDSAKPDNSFTSITISDEHTLYENDAYSWAGSGRELYDSYNYANGNTRTYNLSTPDAADGSALLRVTFAAKSDRNVSTLSVEADGKSIGEVSIASTAGDTYIKAAEATGSFTIGSIAGTTTAVKLTHNRATGVAGRLNYITLCYKRHLRLSGPSLRFRSVEAVDSNATFTIEGADDGTVVWDVTPGCDYRRMNGTFANGKFTFSTAADGTLHEYVAVNTAATQSEIESWQQVATQNLHGMGATDMVIIVPAGGNLTAQAERLAQAHRDTDGMTVQVVSAEEVYNEFSSGTPDATAYRRLMKMLYDRATDDSTRPKYLLLMGDCTYDNRMLTSDWRGKKPADYLLSYQVAESCNEKLSYMTDDYFGFLNDGDGEALASCRLRIGVGRIPVTTAGEAQSVVDKIIAYMNNDAAGEWKRSVAFVADDAEGSNSDNSFMQHAAELADSLRSYNPTYHAELLLEDAYQRKATTTGYTYPDAKARLQQLLTDGVLMLNYTGHSTTDSWTAERLLTASTITELSNSRPALWFVASCDFCRFDAADASGGELALLNGKGGAIGAIGTGRVVYDTPNFTLHSALISTIFGHTDGSKLRLGDIMRLAKQADKTLLSDANKLNFNLLGDPALALAMPEHNIRITEMNGLLTGDISDDDLPAIKARSSLTLKGVVEDSSGTQLTDFDGTINLLLLDSYEQLSTLDNAGKGAVAYTDHSRTLYSGTDSVSGGAFELTIPIPIDISYSGESGVIKLYALAADKRDAGGSFSSFVVGTTIDEIEGDEDGPEVTALYLNTPDFCDGATVNCTPCFVAELNDENGINASGSGIGHDLTLTIDGTTTYTLNSYFSYDSGSYTAGRISFSMPELTEGSHTLSFKAWDMVGNSTTEERRFNVAEGLSPEISELRATVSPARTSTIFVFSHNRPLTAMSVKITVRNVNGQTVWSRTEANAVNEGEYRTEWDLTDMRGRRVPDGIYIYSAEVTADGSKRTVRSRKLLVLAP
jgi:hypothetical protein